MSAAAQDSAGQIKAARIEGEVFKISADGTRVQLNNGDALVETDSVQTGASGSVVLVFQNGSTVRVAPATKMGIDRFKMDPLAEGFNVAAATEEASPSQTELNLEFGEIVGNVKKLKGTSNYSIKTPVGAAGIRGTIFRIVFRPTGDGRAFNFQVTTAEGQVVFEGTTAAAGGPVDVPAGQEIVVTVQVNEQGQATITTPVQTQQVSTQTQQQIQQAVQQVAEVLQQVTFTPTPPTPPTPPPTPPPEPPPPPPTSTAPPLTPGAGQG